VNLLPFHRTALHKWQRLGLVHSLEGVPAPSAEFMERAAETFGRMGLKTKAGG